MDHETAQRWLDRYVAAWKSYDADEIAGLFSDGVRYRYYPYAVWIVGRDAVVASWLAEDTDAQGSTRDDEGTYDAHYAPIAVDGDVVVATGTTTYTRDSGRPGDADLRQLLRDALRRAGPLPRVHRVLHEAPLS